MSHTLTENALGQLVLATADGHAHVGVVPVRAFPLHEPEHHLALVGEGGKELVWIAALADRPEAEQALLRQALAAREYMPEIRRIVAVSTFATPSRWQVETDRGPTELVLKVEEDIRRLDGRRRLLITSDLGLVFHIPDATALDRQSKKFLERFL